MRERGGQATPSPPSLAARFGLDSRVSAQKAAGVPGALKVMGLGRVERLASSTAAAVPVAGSGVGEGGVYTRRCDVLCHT